jgi:hypothetical protein
MSEHGFASHEIEYVTGATPSRALLTRMLHLSYFDWLPAGVARPDIDEFA